MAAVVGDGWGWGIRMWSTGGSRERVIEERKVWRE